MNLLKVCVSGRIPRQTKGNVEASPNKVDDSSSSEEDLGDMAKDLEKLLDENAKVQLKKIIDEVESAKTDEEKLEGFVCVDFFASFFNCQFLKFFFFSSQYYRSN